MSRSLNKVTLMGNLGAAPEIRTIPSGARVARLSLATTRRWTDSQGQSQERTEWHRCEVWSGIPAFTLVEQYAGKGDQLYVEGSLEYHSYEDKDGTTRWVTTVRVSEVLVAGQLTGPRTEDRPEPKPSRTIAPHRTSRTAAKAGRAASTR